MISREQLQDILIQSGNRDISSTPDNWSADNPLVGHCAVVALVVQDLQGGDLLRASLEGTTFAFARSHYWNLLPDGTEADFTESQFEGNRPQLVGEVRTREYVLSNEQTRQRYEALKSEVQERLLLCCQ